MLTKEDKILIKNVWESKNYGVRRLIKQHCKFEKWIWLFLFSFAVNVNEQRIIVF